jgi:spectinomycin phosphotransferase
MLWCRRCRPWTGRPFRQGQPQLQSPPGGHFGDQLPTVARVELLGALAALHGATPRLREPAPVFNTTLPPAPAGAGSFRGPFSESRRGKLAGGPGRSRAGLTLRPPSPPHREHAGGLVLTHGEPHAGNLIRSADRLFLVDGDTVALAPPERDLWLLDDGTPDGFQSYQERPGRPAPWRGSDLGWALQDVADFVTLLRPPHEQDADTEL